MEGPLDAIAKWSGRQWAGFIFLACLAHVGLLLWFSRDRVLQLPRSTPNFEVRVVTPPRALPLSVEQTDPIQFALVTTQGFSGAAWLRIPQFQYKPANVAAPFQTLALPTEELAADFAEFVRTNYVADDLALETIRPARTELRLPEPVVVPAATWRVDGALAGRTMMPGGTLPSLQEPILTNSQTVVQVVVNPAGQTLSAALLSSCGVTQADQAGLRFAASARYAPVVPEPAADPLGAGLMFGTLTFQWAEVRWETPKLAAAGPDKP